MRLTTGGTRGKDASWLLFLSVTAGTVVLCGPLLAETSVAPLAELLKEKCEGDFAVRAVLSAVAGSPPKISAHLSICQQEDGSGYYVEVTRSTARLLKRLPDGTVRPLAQPAPLSALPPDGLRLSVQRRGQALRLIAGDELAVTAMDADLQEGRIGYGAVHGARWTEVRYQPLSPIEAADDFMRAKGQEGMWKPVRGSWELAGPRAETQAPSAAISANPFTYCGTVGGERVALTVGGHWFWTDYGVASAIRPLGEGDVGLCLYYQDSANYLAFRWSAGLTRGRKQLVRCRNGRAQVLAEAAGGFEENQWYWVEVRACHGRLTAYVACQPVLRAATSAYGQGACGLAVYGEGARALFDDVLVRSVEPSAAPLPFPAGADVPAHFVKDKFLRLWATNEGAWQRVPGDAFWHRGAFFSDASLSLTLPAKPPNDAQVWGVVGAASRDPASGYRLLCQTRGGSGNVTWVLHRGGEPVVEKQAPRGQVDPGGNLELVLASGTVEASFDGVPVLSYVDPNPLHGELVGYGVKRWPVSPLQASARCALMADHTFSSAPVRWREQRGLWETEPHWACVGRGAHLCGMDLGMATLWGKERYKGDLVVEAYVTNAEIPAHVLDAPVHLNLTLNGDGVNPSSGYAFLLGVGPQKMFRMFRDGEQVAAGPYRTKRQIAHNQDIWFYLRAEKRGAVVTYSVDDEVVCQFRDPDPIDEGQLAFWTYHTGIVLGRVRVWHAEPPVLASPPPAVVQLDRLLSRQWWRLDDGTRPRAPSSPAAVCDFERGFGSFTTRDEPDAALLVLDSTTAAGGGRSLKVINRCSGGHFSVWAAKERTELKDHPVLRFDYRVPAGVKVNLYARVGETWHEIAFTAPREGVSVGAVAVVVPDGTWRLASVNLLECLRAAKATHVDELAFASPNDPLLRCGFGGNRFGAAYHLDNFGFRKE